MQEINIPDYANTLQAVNLRGLNQNLKLGVRFITREGIGWVLDIRKPNGDYLIRGIRLQPSASPEKLFVFDELQGGGFYVLRKTSTLDLLSRDNFGINKDYGLFWLLDRELQ